MAPLKQFEKRMQELVRNGCTTDNAYQIASQEFSNLADRADQLLEIKQQIEWDQRRKK